MFNFLFGKRTTPQEALRKNIRSLNKAQRELERERVKMEAQEKKLIADIKKAAKADQRDACKVMAKDLVRTRRYIQKFHKMGTSLQAVSLRIQSLNSNQKMAVAMRGATTAMKSMNKSMNLPGMQKVLMDFERESETMDMKEEMMNDAIDDAMEDNEMDDEEESEELVNRILDEVLLEGNQALGTVPKTIKEQSAVAEGVGAFDPLDDDAALQARLDSLRRE
ncbi:ESCRT-III subunit protein did4 [Coemansia sp. RSA 2671]|uniref:ESCRT-III subunit protein did4 n=1 Tax=Coemansia spiralis TaxID=417178 RepID=A0A9W8GNS0_9FUNG|nr:ESCRT-III subunit protein did4 [Coemansia sp. RSA 2675]KAJ2342518.1 ESCRT-III subunit protein did4 [Coemansia sp. RSA 2671]KAJ2381061.1 ESCRT-III subunit protein did4 [Coemansia sp. RSA 2611]KAJ2410689.1 ESCRT-III subunit protein did4 [Coemansia sp. RSA 2530]KAJ2690158.1 ESCRT-III subunit protein did4 [Coemansia spiralis]KAJ2703147.1 ESCRT-III subunit protein did4 [Coemansia sp. IMI 209128]